MLCGPVGIYVQVGVPAFEVVIVIAVGVMPDTAVDEVRVCVIWIVVGLASEPVTSTGADREFVLVAGLLPGTHVNAPPVMMLASALAFVVQMFVTGLYDQKAFLLLPWNPQIVVPSVVSAPPAL